MVWLPLRLSAQPAADSCVNATTLLLPSFVGQINTIQGHNIGAAPELTAIFNDCSPGGLFSGFGADVWYTFSPTYSGCLRITVDGLEAPEFNVLEGFGGCLAGLELICESGSGGTVSGTIEVSAFQQYRLRVSGGSQADQGYFNLSVQRISCQEADNADPEDNCLIDDRLELNPLPGEGNLYLPGQTVEVCYTITGWNNIQDNWLHGVQVELGAGWDQFSIQPDYVESCNLAGQWIWLDSWTSCNTGNTYGPGFAYESSQGIGCGGFPNDFNPGNNWGDGGGPCTTVPGGFPERRFCWTMEVLSCQSTDDMDLGIDITVLGDGESGSWELDACGSEVDESVSLGGDCGEYECNFWGAGFQSQDVTCIDIADGSFSVNTAGLPADDYDIFVYDLYDVLLDSAIGVAMPYVHPSVLDTGYYGILVRGNWAVDNPQYCNIGVASIIRIKPPFEIFPELLADCQAGASQLSVRTWPPQPNVSYQWTGPGGFLSTEETPLITESGMYYVEVDNGSCTLLDSIDLQLPGDFELEAGYWQGPPCTADNQLRLYSSGLGVNSGSYQWIDTSTGFQLFLTSFSTNGVLVWDFGNIEEDINLLLVGIDEYGCKDTIAFTAEIFTPPPFNYESNIANCDGETIEIQVVNNPGLEEVLWLDKNSTDNTRYFDALDPGEVNEILVLLTYENGCQAQDTIDIVGPGVALSTSDSIVCIGQEITIEASPGQAYLWNTGDTAAVLSVIASGGGPTTYSVTLTDIYGCPYMDSIEILVANFADAEFTYVLEGASTYHFQPTAPIDPYADYLWLFGDGSQSTEYAPTHTYTENDSFSVRLIVATRCGVEETIQTISPALMPEAAFTAHGQSGCAPFVITFINQSQYADSYAWEFPGGTPATSTNPTPTVTYAEPGVYDVQLTVSNEAGSSTLLETAYLTVNTTPTGSFTYTEDYLLVDFTASTADANNLSWDFGDGNSSPETSPAHEYPEGGEYEVILTLENECGSIEVSETISVEAQLPPQAGFSSSVLTGCAPLTVSFTNESTGADSYAWSFPGGTPATSTEANPTVTYPEAGTYDVQLTATNEAGETELLETAYIMVNTTPTGSFTYTEDYLLVDFTATTADANSLSWDFGDGNTSTESAPAHEYAEGGEYEVVLTLENECGTIIITDTLSVEAEPPPLVAFSAVSDNTGCAPLTVTFMNESTGADSYMWNFPGGMPVTSTETNPTVIYTEPGIYNVELIAINGGGSSALNASEYIMVYTEPTGSFEYSTNYLEVAFTSNSEGAATLSWDFGDGNSSTMAQPVHEYAEAGTYIVSLLLENECGMVELTDTIMVEAQALPQVGFSTLGETSGCAPLTVSFINESNGAESYAWSFPGGMPATSTDASPTVVYTSTGVYDVTLAAINAAGEEVLLESGYITVSTTPVGSFTYEADALTFSFMADATGATTYSWDFGDGNSSMEVAPVHQYAEGGTYIVTLLLENECGTTTLTDSLNLMITSTANRQKEKGWRIYPNPNGGDFWLEANDCRQSSLRDLVAWNALGERVYTRAFASGEADCRMRVSLPAVHGVYWLRVVDENGNGNLFKVVVQ